MEEINKMHKTSFRLGHVAEADGALDRRNEQRVGIARAAPTLMRRAREQQVQWPREWPYDYEYWYK